MKNTTIKLPKAATGIQFGDVSNASVRNILTILSNTMFHKITRDELEETEEFFSYMCPYTGKDLRNAILNKTGEAQGDHIVPQNRKYCGLNVKGNLVFVDREANRIKGEQSFEDFIRNDTKVVTGTPEEREARIVKIKEWQQKCGYDPEALQKELSQRLPEIYDEIRKTQERYIKELAEKIEYLVPQNNIYDVADGEAVRESKRKSSRYSEKQKLALIEDYLFNGTSLEKLEQKHLGVKQHGNAARNILIAMGVEDKKQHNKGVFKGISIEEAIEMNLGRFNKILNQIKNNYDTTTEKAALCQKIISDELTNCLENCFIGFFGRGVDFKVTSANATETECGIERWAKENNINLFVIEPDGTSINNNSKTISGSGFASRIIAPTAEQIDEMSKPNTVLFFKNIHQIKNKDYRYYLMRLVNRDQCHGFVADGREPGNYKKLENILFSVATVSASDLSSEDYYKLFTVEAKDVFVSHVDVEKEIHR